MNYDLELDDRSEAVAQDILGDTNLVGWTWKSRPMYSMTALCQKQEERNGEAIK